MTAPTPTPATLNAAVEAGARAHAASVGLDLDNLRAHAWPSDTERELEVWRANLLDEAKVIIEAALPILAAADAGLLAQAHAAGAAEGAAAERERWTGGLREMAVGIKAGSSVGGENPCCESCPAWALNYAADAIAHAGASEVDHD